MFGYHHDKWLMADNHKMVNEVCTARCFSFDYLKMITTSLHHTVSALSRSLDISTHSKKWLVVPNIVLRKSRTQIQYVQVLKITVPRFVYILISIT